MAAEYKHENGYSAKLYGGVSMTVYYKGKEVSHIGFRNANTKEEVMKMLDRMPDIMKIVHEKMRGEEDERN